MSRGREQSRWQTQVDPATNAAVTVVPMAAAAAAAIALQYTGTVQDLQAKLTAAGTTAVVITKSIDKALRTSITAQLGQEVANTDLLIIDLYAASNTQFGKADGVILERIGVATFKADGAAVIDGVGANADLQLYYPKTVAFSSDLRVEARSKVALDSVSGQTPATVEITDPGEIAGIVAVLHKHASLQSVATAALVWKEWE